GAAEARADDVGVVAAGRVDLLDEARNDVVGDRADFLDGDNVEIADGVGEDLHDFGLIELFAAEDLDIKAGDFDGGGVACGNRAAATEERAARGARMKREAV